ncbi:MAG TPA: hypothetical protein VL119_10560 [Acidimicrobiia bacterium]|nr:hypothetical protein [Acidimicrobiia bacterium]
MTSLAEKVLALDDALAAFDAPHAFGGALALAFHIAEPRGTRDIDINVFVPASDAPAVFAALPDPIEWGASDMQEAQRDGQVRVFWDDTPVDLFFDTHPFHQVAAGHVEVAPFGGRDVPILAADDLAVFKAFFNRTKDWADIEAMIDAHTLDIHAVLGWIVDLIGPNDRRVARFREVMHRIPPSEPRFTP